MKSSIVNSVLAEIVPQIIKKAIRQLRIKKEIKPYMSTSLGSYSQYNEDLIVDLLLGMKEHGYYVDVGANDPELLSNTMRFYKRGWNGICIEPNFKLFEKLERIRTRDVNLNLGISRNSGEMTFYEMSADTLSTFDKEVAKESERIYNAHIIKTHQIKVEPLSDVLNKYNKDNFIDLLSVDTEGYDYQIIQSNDWVKFKPRIIIIEINHEYDQIVNFLRSKGYDLMFNNSTNGIFKRNDIA